MGQGTAESGDVLEHVCCSIYFLDVGLVCFLNQYSLTCSGVTLLTAAYQYLVLLLPAINRIAAKSKWQESLTISLELLPLCLSFPNNGLNLSSANATHPQVRSAGGCGKSGMILRPYPSVITNDLD